MADLPARVGRWGFPPAVNYDLSLRSFLAINPALLKAAPPFNQDDWPVPQQPQYPVSLRTWISQPQAPFPPFTVAVYIPSRVTDWGYWSDPRVALTWTQGLLPGAAPTPTLQFIPSLATSWDVPDPVPFQPWPPPRNITLLSGPPPQLPKNQYSWPLPQAPRPAADLITFINDLPFQLIGKDKLPVRQQDWPLPREPRPASDLRTFINDLPFQLIGKDKLPVRQQIWPVPIAPDYSVSLRSFLARSLPLLTTAVVAPTFMPGRVSEWGMWERVPFTPADLPQNIALQPAAVVAVTYIFREPYYSPQWAGARFEVWTTTVNLALRAGPPPQLPLNQDDWPLPIAVRQPDRTWQRSFPPELIGKDRLPIRQQSWPLTPGTEFVNALRSIGFRSPALDVTVQRPFVQNDWPLTPWQARAVDLRTFINKTPTQLIGKDKLPIRQQDWPLPVAPRPASDLRTYIAQSPIKLIGKDRLPFRQNDWPVPRAHLEFHTLRSITQGRVIYGGEVAPISPIPPLPPPEVIHSVRAHADAYYGVFFADEIKGRADFSRAKGSNDEEAAN